MRILLHVQLLCDEVSIERRHLGLVGLGQEDAERVAVLIEGKILADQLVEQQIGVAEGRLGRGATGFVVLVQRGENLAANASLHLAQGALRGQRLQQSWGHTQAHNSVAA